MTKRNARTINLLSLKGFSAAMLAVPAMAAPIFISPFVGTTTVDFETFARGTLINTQLTASHGITFSSALGGIYANNSFISAVGSTMNATSFAPNVCPCADITLTWTAPITAVGFRYGSVAGTSRFILPGGTLTTLSPQFPAVTDIYIGDTAGFSTLTISAPIAPINFTPGGGPAFVIDNVTYTQVGEPSALVLIGLGLVALGTIRSRGSVAVRPHITCIRGPLTVCPTIPSSFATQPCPVSRIICL